MNKSKTYLLLGVIVAILALGVAYAAIGNITLTVNGTASASAAEGSFDVQFTKAESTGVGTAKQLEVLENEKGLIAAFNVEGLSRVGDEFTAKFTIENKSTDLLANISVAEPSNTNSEYFAVTAQLDETSLEQNGGEATLTVKVRLLKLPISDDAVTTSVSALVTAIPVNPTV